MLTFYCCVYLAYRNQVSIMHWFNKLSLPAAVVNFISQFVA